MKEFITACPRNCYSSCGLSVIVDNAVIEAVNDDIALHVNGYLQSDDLTMLSIINHGSDR